MLVLSKFGRDFVEADVCVCARSRLKKQMKSSKMYEMSIMQENRKMRPAWRKKEEKTVSRAATPRPIYPSSRGVCSDPSEA